MTYLPFSLPVNIWLALVLPIAAAAIGLHLVETNLLRAGLFIAAAGLLMIVDYTPATDLVLSVYFGSDLPFDSSIINLIKPPMPTAYILFAVAVMIAGAVMEAVSFHRDPRNSPFRS